MMDAYTHLDVTAPDPIADFKARMTSAEIDRALVIETWKGDNYSSLRTLIASGLPQFRVVPCFRPEDHLPALDLFDSGMVAGVRAKSADLCRMGNLAGRLESLGKWLVLHAEQGIGPLTCELGELLSSYPGLRVYLPHCGWPRQNKLDDKNWEKSIEELSRLPNVVAGISAIAHFSREAFPHNDIRSFVARLVDAFGADSVLAGSDFPMFEMSLYTDYIKLAQELIKQEDASWSPQFESLIFNTTGI